MARETIVQFHFCLGLVFKWYILNINEENLLMTIMQKLFDNVLAAMPSFICLSILVLNGCPESPSPESASLIRAPANQNENEDGPAENIFLARQQEQLILRRALATLPAFYGDGQIRFLNGGWNGSIFLFSDSTFMTNAHVVTSDNSLLVPRPIDQLEYIVFPLFVFYKRSLYDQIHKYEEERFHRMKKDHEQAKSILQKRIESLENKEKKTTKDVNHLFAYKGDLGLLNRHSPIPINERAFIPLDEAVEEIWTPQERSPDMALIVLKKPLQQLIPRLNNILTDEYFAAKNIYQDRVNGRIFSGTPLYIAGYGRESGSATDKNKSLKAFHFIYSTSAGSQGVGFWPAIDSTSFYEKDFYYYQYQCDPGDSGSRIWAYIDGNQKLNLIPPVLDQKKIAVGITTHNGGGEEFSDKTLIPLFNKFSQRFPAIFNRELASIVPAKWPRKASETIPYLLNLAQDTPKDFLFTLYYYFIWRNFLSEQFYRDLAEYTLWALPLQNLTIYQTIFNESRQNLNTPFGYIGGKFDEKATAALAQKLGKRSPSDLSLEKYIALLISAKVFSAEEEIILKHMSEGRLFEKFGPNFRVTIRNLSKPLLLKDYLAAFEQWVKKHAYQNPSYIISPLTSSPDSARNFANIGEIVALDD